MLIRPPLESASERVLNSLEELLLLKKNRTLCRRDIIFSTAFILVANDKLWGFTTNRALKARTDNYR